MQRPLTPLALAAAVVPCAFLAWSIGGQSGVGVLLGYLVGAGLAGLSFAWQRHAWRWRPERALRAHLEGFFIKVGGLLLSLIPLRGLESVAAQVDLRAYVLGFAAAVALALPLLAVDANQMLRSGRRGA